MGTSSLQPSWSPIGSRQSNDWPIVASMQIRRARDSINAMLATIISESFTSPWTRMASVCKICAETHWTAGSASPLRRLPGPGSRRGGAGRVRRWTFARDPPGPRAPGPPRCGSRPVRGRAHCRQRAAGDPPLSGAAGAPSCRAVEPNCRRIRPSLSPRNCFRPPSNIEGFVAFGHEEGDEAMSISASEKDGWAGSEPEQLGSSEPFRPPGGAHEGSVESCSGVGAHLESSGGACQE